MDGHKRHRSLPAAFIPLFRIKHQAVGGASNYQGIWGCQGLTISPHVSSLRRQIGDYIDYSIPPLRLPLHQHCIQHTTLLPIQNINSWISYPSPYSNGRLGYKQLNVSELSHLFGFPSSHCRLNLRKESFPVVPLQVLDALLHSAYESLVTHPITSSTLSIPKHGPEGTATYLTSINKILPHTWRNAIALTDKAAKADDAIIPTYIWDTRITSIYPMFTPSCLSTFRSVLLAYSSKRIYKEFCSYLLTK